MKTVKRIFAVLLTVCMVMGLSVSAAGAGVGEYRLRGVSEPGTITVQNAIEDAEYKAYQMLALYEYAEGDDSFVYVVTDAWKEFFVNLSAAGSDKTADAIKSYFLVEEIPGNEGIYFVSWVEMANETEESKNARMESFAALAETYIEGKGEAFAPISTAHAVKNEADSTVSALIENLPLGYYFVNTNGGSAVMIDTVAPNQTIEEKNTAPSIEKRVKSERGETYTGETITADGDWHKSNTASIGDTVTFKTTINVGTGATNYVLHDSMTKLTFANVTSVKLYVVTVEGASATYAEKLTLTAGTHYKVKTTDTCSTTVSGAGSTTETCDFEVEFKNSIFDENALTIDGEAYTIKEGDRLVVEYTATLDADAEVGNDVGNPNKTVLTYGNLPTSTSTPLQTPQDETKTYTYKFDLVKTNKKNEVLTDAEFMLHDSSIDEADRTADNAIKLVEVKEGDKVTGYRVATAEDTNTVTTIKAGSPTITGLGNGTYYLTEITAPDGYKKLTIPATVTIENANIDAVITQTDDGNGVTIDKLTEGTGVQVINVKKSIFPHTGGMGTTIYYLAGGAIIALVAASAVIVFKKRQGGKV